MNHKLYNEIRDFTLRELWEPKGGLTPETRLVEDIRIAGLDGKEFMDAYAKNFSVELPGFDWVDYFGPEAGCNPFSLLVSLFQRASRRPYQTNDYTITLKDLADWAEAGVWSPPDNSEQVADAKPDNVTS